MPSIPQVFSTDLTLAKLAVGRKSGSYISDLVAPITPVDLKKAWILRVDPNASMHRDMDTIRAEGAPTKVVDFDVDREKTYDCTDHALKLPLPGSVLNSPILLLQKQQTYTRRLANILKINKEKKLMALLVANLTGDLTATTPTGGQFSNTASTPLTDLETKIDAMTPRAGVRANSMALDISVLSAICRTSQFLNAVKYTGVPTISVRLEQLRGLLDLDNIYVTRSATENTALPEATPTFSPIWGDKLLLFHQEPLAEDETSSLMVTPTWNGGNEVMGSAGAMVDGWMVDTYDEVDTKSRNIRVSRYYDQLYLYPAGDTQAPGFLYTDCLA